MPRYLFQKKIQEAVVAAIRECGEDIFNMSQYLVPVATGKLKKSGRLRKIPNGIQIVYKADYAAPVEFGVSRHKEMVRRYWVRPYFRRFNHFHGKVTIGPSGRRVVTHTLGAIANQNGMLTRSIQPYHLKVRMKKKQAVMGHYRGPYGRNVSGRMGRFYLRTSVDNIYPDIITYIEDRLTSMP